MASKIILAFFIQFLNFWELLERNSFITQTGGYMHATQIALFIGYDNLPTTLQDGDVLMVTERHGTVGFARNGNPIKRSEGDDKFIACGVCVTQALMFFGISTELVSDLEGVKLYRLRVRNDYLS